MRLYQRTAATLLFTLLFALVSTTSTAQQTGKKATKKSRPKAVAAKRTGRLPPYFGQIGLSRDKANEIRKVAAEFDAKIAELRKQLRKLQQERLQACEKLLTEEQLAQLKKLREAAAAKRRSRTRKKVAN